MNTRATLSPHRLLGLCAVFFALGAVACGAPADRPGEYQYDESGETDDPNVDEEQTEEPEETDPTTPTAECVEGSTQTCKINLPSQGSVKNCATGTQYCEDGMWSECEPDPM